MGLALECELRWFKLRLEARVLGGLRKTIHSSKWMYAKVLSMRLIECRAKVTLDAQQRINSITNTGKKAIEHPKNIPASRVFYHDFATYIIVLVKRRY